MEHDYFIVQELPDFKTEFYLAGYHVSYTPAAMCTLHVSHLPVFLEALQSRIVSLKKALYGNYQTEDAIVVQYDGTILNYDINSSEPVLEYSKDINLLISIKGFAYKQPPSNATKISKELAVFLKEIWIKEIGGTKVKYIKHRSFSKILNFLHLQVKRAAF